MKSLPSRLLGVTVAFVAAAACSSSPSPPGTTGGASASATSSSATSGSTSSAGGAGTSAAVTASVTGAGGGGGGATASGTGGTGGLGGGASSSSTGSSSVSSSGSGGSAADLDADGDGWTPNEGDCCDTLGQCNAPQLINPGAFEFPGNGVDDDCDPLTIDNGAALDCAPPALMAPTSADDLVKAMDLCQLTTEVPPKPLRKWGVLASSLHLADGTSTPKDIQTGVLAGFGANVVPQGGPTMAAISTGSARSQNNSGFVTPQAPSSYNASTEATQPAQFLAAHGGVDPTPPTCAPCVGIGCGKAFDSVDLKVRIRVPTNASSFSYRTRFFTAEYPERLCSTHNDFFVVLLKTGWKPDPNQMPPSLPLPIDTNILLDSQGNPVSVDNAFFPVCFPTPGAPPGSCPGGTLDLVGSGYGGPGNSVSDGAATDWLVSDAPVVPGETIELELVVWDAIDHQGDSLALIDKFRWTLPDDCGGPCGHP